MHNWPAWSCCALMAAVTMSWLGQSVWMVLSLLTASAVGAACNAALVNHRSTVAHRTSVTAKVH